VTSSLTSDKENILLGKTVLDQELISSHLAIPLVVLVVGVTSSKMPKVPSFQIGSGWHLAGMFFK